MSQAFRRFMRKAMLRQAVPGAIAEKPGIAPVSG